MAPTVKTCVRCGAALECGRAAGAEKCWCAELPPVMPVTDEGCLCKRCLTEEVARRVCGETSPPAVDAVEKAGLCAGCGNARELRTKGGEAIYLCRLSDSDSHFAKYPRLPVLSCGGYSHRTA